MARSRVLAAAALAAFASIASAAQDGATPRPFAAPTVATQAPASGASGFGEVMLALVLVLLSIFAVAWLLRRLRGLGGGGSAAIEVLAQVALGTRERAVIVRVGDQRLLLGVAPGRVSMLHALPADAQLPTSPAAGTPDGPLPPSFAALLKKSLGR